ncbi:MAG TPA: hypothetical protein VG602_01770 [Actinomycetota bacterium]|nr:hypothetical protein [Actinomycetota bacterium]
MAERGEHVVCVVCGRKIDECACCQNDRCGDPICHRDLLFATNESRPQPHPHGG